MKKRHQSHNNESVAPIVTVGEAPTSQAMNTVLASTITSIITSVMFIMIMFFTTTTFAVGLSCQLPSCDERMITSGDGVTQLFVRNWGAQHPNRPTLLFSHGFPHDNIQWNSVIESDLRQKFRLITMDLRGMGASDKPTDPTQYAPEYLAEDIQAVLDAFQVKKVVLVGTSYGGIPLVDYLYLKGTTQVAGMVFVNAAYSVPSLLAIVTPAAGTAVGPTFPPTTPEAFLSGNQDFLTLSYSPQNIPRGHYEAMLSEDLMVSPEVRCHRRI